MKVYENYKFNMGNSYNLVFHTGTVEYWFDGNEWDITGDDYKTHIKEIGMLSLRRITNESSKELFNR